MQNPQEVDGNVEPLLLQALKQSFDQIDGRGFLDLHTVIYDTEVSLVSGRSKMEAASFRNILRFLSTDCSIRWPGYSANCLSVYGRRVHGS